MRKQIRCVLHLSGYSFESDILSSESQEVKIKLEEWLLKVGIWGNCWRATRDGWTSGTLQGKCGSAAPTLAIVKAEKNDVILIFGGHATAGWCRGKLKKLHALFFFVCLKNKVRKTI